MCDPSMIAIASLASTVVGTAGSMANAASQRSAQKKQEQEVNAWQQQQKKNRDAEKVRQEGLRQEADKARVAGLEQVSGDAQSKRQGDEEARLAQYLAGKGDASTAAPEPGAPQAQADAALSGQQGGDPVVQTDLAKKISEAAAGVSQRIGALATVSSFGESFGGLGPTNQMIQGDTGSQIDMFNEFRRGDLGQLAQKQAVDPVQVSWSPSPLADIFSTALSVGPQGLGNAYGTNHTFLNAPVADPHFGPPKPLPKYLANTNSLF